MRCSNCQNEVLQSALYCNHCGNQLQVRCNSCRALNSTESNFCNACGANLRAGTPTGARFDEEPHDPYAASFASVQCPRCSGINEPGSTYCYRCGYPLEGAQLPAQLTIGETTFHRVQPAGFWIRFVAYIVDWVVTAVVEGLLFALFAGDSGIGGIFDESLGALDFWSYLMTGAYFTIGVAVWSTTIGKRIFGLYVMRPDGSRVGVGRALGRYLATILSGIILFIGFIMIGVRRDKRGLHDLIADTVVVRK